MKQKLSIIIPIVLMSFSIFLLASCKKDVENEKPADNGIQYNVLVLDTFSSTYPIGNNLFCKTGDGEFAVILRKAVESPRLIIADLNFSIKLDKALATICYKIDKIIPDYDGGFIIAGMHTTSVTGYYYVLYKLNATGDIVWQKEFPQGIEYPKPISVCKADNNSTLMATIFKEAGETALYVLKFDSTGDLMWKRSVSTDNLDINNIMYSKDENIIITAETFIMCLTKEAEMKWVKADIIYHFEHSCLLQDGSVVVISGENLNYNIYKYNASGALMSQNIIDVEIGDFPLKICEIPGNGILISGMSGEVYLNNTLLVLKINYDLQQTGLFKMETYNYVQGYGIAPLTNGFMIYVSTAKQNEVGHRLLIKGPI